MNYKNNYLLIIFVFLISCTGAKISIDTFIIDDIEKIELNKIMVMPLLNDIYSQKLNSELGNILFQKIIYQYRNQIFYDPLESKKMLFEKMLYSKWEVFYNNYSLDNNYKDNTLSWIRDALKVDVLLFADIVNFEEVISKVHNFRNNTHLELKLSLFSTLQNQLIWQSVVKIQIKNSDKEISDPDIVKFYQLAIDEIILSLPFNR